MKLILLYLLLLKATATSFSGLSSLPVLREDLVVRHGLLTDRQLNIAVTAGRSGPGPNANGSTYASRYACRARASAGWRW